MKDTYKTRLNLYMLAFIAYWYAPVVYAFWLWQDLKMGALSTDTDTIALPLIAFLFLWFVGFPFFIVSTFGFEMVLRRREGRTRTPTSGTKHPVERQIV